MNNIHCDGLQVVFLKPITNYHFKWKLHANVIREYIFIHRLQIKYTPF